MPERSAVTYLYDGSYEGLLCCVFETYKNKETPQEISPHDAQQMTLYESRTIPTDFAIAQRVADGLSKKASPNALKAVEYGYYTCYDHKEMMILEYIRLAMSAGRKVTSMLTHPAVHTLNAAVSAMGRETHRMMEFLRFSIHDGLMLAVIEPENYVLPMIAPHFCDRFANDTFMIYDANHSDALIYRPGQSQIVHVSDFTAPAIDENERKFRGLWKVFYDTIAIDERYNPQCRLTHMPKRYWKHMTEMNEALFNQPAVIDSREKNSLQEKKRLQS